MQKDSILDLIKKTYAHYKLACLFSYDEVTQQVVWPGKFNVENKRKQEQERPLFEEDRLDASLPLQMFLLDKKEPLLGQPFYPLKMTTYLAANMETMTGNELAEYLYWLLQKKCRLCRILCENKLIDKLSLLNQSAKTLHLILAVHMDMNKHVESAIYY